MSAPRSTGHSSTIDGAGGLKGLIDELVDRVGSIRKALVLSGDGWPTAASKGFTREDSEHLSALASGFHSLAKGAGRRFDVGGVRQTVVELDRAFLFVAAAGDESCVAVLADADSDMSEIAYELALLEKRVIPYLDGASRSGLSTRR